jgi:hypothetical protein
MSLARDSAIVEHFSPRVWTQLFFCDCEEGWKRKDG